MKIRITKFSRTGAIIAMIFIAIMIISSLVTRSDTDLYSGLNKRNFSIDSLTEEQMLKITTFGSTTFLRERSSGNRSGISGSDYKEKDYDNTYFRVKKATGIEIINATKATDSTVNLKIDFTVSSGNAKLIIVMDESVILEEFEPNQPIDFTYESVGTHTFVVKLLSEKAKVEIEVNRTIT